MSARGPYLEAALWEFRRMKALAEKAIAQVEDDRALHATLGPESNSVAVIVQHLAGNMLSRWTDFLTTDGEKPDRNRDGEFEERPGEARAALMARWERGFRALFEAVNRQVAHYAYHVGQIVLLARHLAGARWTSLSIPRGRSAEGGFYKTERPERS